LDPKKGLPDPDKFSKKFRISANNFVKFQVSRFVNKFKVI